MASFPRARILRFNEVAGCAPPPGTYEPKISEKPLLGKFDKSERFTKARSHTSRQECPDTPMLERRSSVQLPKYKEKDTPNLQRSNSLFHSRRPNVSTSPKNKEITVEGCSSKGKCGDEKSQSKEVQECSSKPNEVSDTGNANSTVICVNCIKRSTFSEKQMMRLRKVNQRLEVETMGLIAVTRHEALEKMLQEIKGSMPEVVGTIRELEFRNLSLNKMIKRLQGDVMEYRIQICTLQDSLDEVSLIKNQAEGVRTKLISEIAKRDNIISLCQVKIDEVKSDLAREIAENKNLKTEIKEMSKEFVVSNDTINQLTLDLIQLGERCKSKDAENKALADEISQLSDGKNKEIYKAREEHARITDLLCLLQDMMEKKELMFKSTVDNVERILKDVCDPTDGMATELNGDSNDTKVDNVSVSSQVTVEEDEGWQSKLSVLLDSIGKLVKRTAIYNTEIHELKRDLEAKIDQLKSLESLIGPYRDQLEHNEQERQVLSDMTTKTREELEKLSLKHAANLGHQNPRQKIKYVVRLKESNLKLKDEINDLQAKIRQKDRQISRLMRNTLKSEAKNSPSQKSHQAAPANTEKPQDQINSNGKLG